jgi:hypothetical protein
MQKLKPVVGFSMAMLALNVAVSTPAFAWGDKGHEVTALVAQAYLTPAALKKVNALLSADTDTLTPHDIASAATWADKYRDMNIDNARQRTGRWHFANIETKAPSLDAACFHFPALPQGKTAAEGQANDCVVDKIEEFAAELSNKDTSLAEQIVALKYLLHFTGDLHQPLHASDENDRGGNDKKVVANGFASSNLHHFWDVSLVAELGPNATSIASDLIGHISKAQAAAWAKGTPRDWALETFEVSKASAYGGLPEPDMQGVYHLTDDYVSTSTRVAAMQLSKAGVRIAFLLNEAFDQ